MPVRVGDYEHELLMRVNARQQYVFCSFGKHKTTTHVKDGWWVCDKCLQRLWPLDEGVAT